MDWFKSKIKYFTQSIEMINTAILCNDQTIDSGLIPNILTLLYSI